MNDIQQLCSRNLISSTGKPYSEMTRKEELITFLIKEGHIHDVKFYSKTQPKEVAREPQEPDTLESAS